MRIEAQVAGGWAAVELATHRGFCCVELLTGSGSPGAMRMLGRELERMALEAPVYFPMAADMPKSLRESRLIARIGGRKVMEMWGMGNTEVFSYGTGS